MTPKEKAIELYNKYSAFANDEFPHTSTIAIAKCCVDDIIKVINNNELLFQEKFWDCVKSELDRI